MDWHTYKDESEIIDLLPKSVFVMNDKGEHIEYPLIVDGEIVAKHLPVRVPLRYCKIRDYDGVQETLSCMGLGLRIGSAHIKPPSLGVYSLMEMTGNPFPINFGETTVIQQFHVLYFNEYRREAAELVRDWHYADAPVFDPEDRSTWSELDIAAINYIDKLGEQGVDLSDVATWVKILDMFGVASSGFEMVPGSGSSRYWYGAESYGTMLAGLGAELGQSLDAIIWDIPLVQLGFAYVGKARSNGVKGIQRPYDRADQRRQRILAYLRELHGELHPWQTASPLTHQLTDEQAKHSECVKQFKQLQESAKPKKAKK